jgi:hypothetical protein
VDAPQYNRESDRQFANGHLPEAKGVYRILGGQRAAGEGSGLSRAGDKRRHFIRHAVGQRHASCGACRPVRPLDALAEEQLVAAMAAANLRHADAWLLRLLHRPFLLATEATGGSTAGPLLAISSDTYTAHLAAALNRTRALG